MLQLHLQAATVSFGLEVIRHIAMQRCVEPTTSTDGGGCSADPMRDDAFSGSTCSWGSYKKRSESVRSTHDGLDRLRESHR
jgi:hypothetical protein